MKMTFTVRREDGDTTVLQGVAGAMICMQSEYIPEADETDDETIRNMLEHMPVVSLRADNAKQLAMILAVLIATVRDTAPEALEPAMALSTAINARNPVLMREAPPRG